MLIWYKTFSWRERCPFDKLALMVSSSAWRTKNFSPMVWENWRYVRFSTVNHNIWRCLLFRTLFNLKFSLAVKNCRSSISSAELIEISRLETSLIFCGFNETFQIAYCSNIAVQHDHYCLRQAAAEEYQKYRKPDDLEIAHINRAWYQRSNFKCIAENKPFGNNSFLRDDFKNL